MQNAYRMQLAQPTIKPLRFIIYVAILALKILFTMLDSGQTLETFGWDADSGRICDQSRQSLGRGYDGTEASGFCGYLFQ
jgi:hypothetical protein